MTYRTFRVGDRVRKVGGSYQATGTVVAAFYTRAGADRYVFEFDQPAGMLHIFNAGQLAHEDSKKLEDE